MAKTFWLVSLITPPSPNHYASNYFPRRFYYKADAVACKNRVEASHGVAMVAKAGLRAPRQEPTTDAQATD